MPKIEWKLEMGTLLAAAMVVFGGIYSYSALAQRVAQIETSQRQSDQRLEPKIDRLTEEITRLREAMARAEAQIARQK